MTVGRIHNAQLVLRDELVFGSLQHENGLITAIDHNPAVSGAVAEDNSVDSALQAEMAGCSEDFDGDFLMPGLVELHTDNFERHAMPRPQTYWPNLLAAALMHDAELAAAGITTVFDSLCVGAYHGEETPRRKLFTAMIEAVIEGREQDLFRAEHYLHFRCELTDPDLMDILQPVAETPGLSLVSLMDHTPGQRQWRDLDALRRFNRGRKPADDTEQSIQQRIEVGDRHVPGNRDAVLNQFRGQAVTLASHDDTTVEHIEEASRDAITIAEFPCSLDAAIAAAGKGMHTIGGAPNIVRGGSHSGNVAVADLARHDVLHGLSSDYVPASLLQAAFILVSTLNWSLPQAIRLISANPADMVGLSDRGQLQPGRRADLLRVKLVGHTPVVRAVYRQGERVL
jgi:alpha-D-ribose 1-methylphosphonate 5-triphosphate diphosphatase